MQVVRLRRLRWTRGSKRGKREIRGDRPYRSGAVMYGPASKSRRPFSGRPAAFIALGSYGRQCRKPACMSSLAWVTYELPSSILARVSMIVRSSASSCAPPNAIPSGRTTRATASCYSSHVARRSPSSRALNAAAAMAVHADDARTGASRGMTLISRRRSVSRPTIYVPGRDGRQY